MTESLITHIDTQLLLLILKTSIFGSMLHAC